MLIKFIILAIVTLSFVSCKEEALKMQFIQDFLNLPDDIEVVIMKSKLSTAQFQSQYFTVPEKKKEILTKLSIEIKKYYSADFKITCNRKRKEFDNTTKEIRYYHEISICGTDEDRNLLFRWSLIMNKWHLQDIIITGRLWCD